MTDERGAVILAARQAGVGAAVARHVLASGRPLVLAGTAADWWQEVAAGHDGLVAREEGDVTDVETGEAAVATASARFGGTYALVNVLPLRPRAPAGDGDRAVTASDVVGDVRSLYSLSRPVATALTQGAGGRIVTVTAGGWLGELGGAAQSTAAAAVTGFTRSLALEVGRHAATVNAVSTAYVDTPEWRVCRARGAGRADRATALRRLGTTQEVAGVVGFLLGADSAFVTGQVLSVCGGATIGKSVY